MWSSATKLQCIRLCVRPHLPLNSGCCYPPYWLWRVRGPGVLWFDLCNILSLILLCEFNTEHTGPFWQKLHRVKCWAIQSKEVRNNNTLKHRTTETETGRLMSFSCHGFELRLPSSLWLTLASSDTIHTEKLQRVSFRIALRLGMCILCVAAVSVNRGFIDAALSEKLQDSYQNSLSLIGI